MTPILHGYRFCVYQRVLRLTLVEKAVAYGMVEVNPFSTPPDPAHLALHPFNRVPVLVHGDFAIYETSAICRYVDEAFPGPALQPIAPQDRARMAQVISIVDNYAYWPLVRQVYAHRVFRPASGETPDEAPIAAGLAAAPAVLATLDRIAAEGRVLNGRLSLADLHLAPMIAGFVAAPEGAAMLAGYAELSKWWQAMHLRPSMTQTDPGLPGVGD